MFLKKSLSLVLIASQLALGSVAASANPVISDSNAPTPEFTLVESVLSLQGQKLTPSRLQAQMTAVMNRYLASASTEGAPERLSRALVDLGVYTQAQAQAFVSDAQKDALRVTSSSQSADTYAESMGQEMEQLAQTHPAGAQFSGYEIGCYGSEIGAALLIIGATTAAIGDYERTDNPTCTTPTTTEYAWNPSTHGYSFISIPTGPTTCAKPNYYPHAQAGTNYEVAGYTMLAVGGILLTIGYFNGFFDACIGD